MGKNKAPRLQSELENLEDTSIDTYRRLLPLAIDPSADPEYNVPNNRMLWKTHFREAGSILTDGPELSMRLDEHTHLSVRKSWWGTGYEDWSLTYSGPAPPQIRRAEDEFMYARARKESLAYHFHYPNGNVSGAGNWFSADMPIKPANREETPLTLIDYLNAAVLKATEVMPPTQNSFIQGFHEASGFELPSAARSEWTDLWREIRSMGAIPVGSTTAVQL